MKKKTSSRWLLFTVGVVAVLGLTVMNVYSLYKLHKSSENTTFENKKEQVSEVAFQVRSRFLEVTRDILKLNNQKIERYLHRYNRISPAFLKVIKKSEEDSLFDGVYFTDAGFQSFHKGTPILKFDPKKNRMIRTTDYSQAVADGIGLTQTRMKVLVKDYHWPTKTLFDTNRSMTITLLNPKQHSIVGYLCLTVNNDYLTNHYLPELLVRRFGKSDVTVWVFDWLRDKVLATNNPSVKYDAQKVQFTDRFPGLLDNWNIKVAMSEMPGIVASKAQFVRNLVILGIAVLILLGSLLFIFITAQKERDLATRQAGFLANVTHELKTPLSVMQAAGENLSDGRVTDPERLAAYGRHIYGEAIRLKQMIEKLLDVARSDAGQLTIYPAVCQAEAIVKDFVELHRPYLENIGFAVRVVAKSSLPPVYVDAEALQTILSNLVDNTVKYSPSSKFIGFYVRHLDNEIQIEVKDHGVGISREAQKHIFDKFFRGEDALTAQTKGHGLGLCIVKNLLDLHGARITLNSQLQKGSAFIIHLPVFNKPIATEAASASPKQKLTTKKNDTSVYALEG